jgi:hypothetical protein
MACTYSVNDLEHHPLGKRAKMGSTQALRQAVRQLRGGLLS